MKKAVELPIVAPLYSTYHSQGNAGAILTDNLSIRNWYLNQVMMLCCNRRFLYGAMTPDVTVDESTDWENPYLKRVVFSMKYLGKSIHPVIRALLDDGYYVGFNQIDDYYIKGKSWYRQKHYYHDGLLFGYDQNDGTYLVYAYDDHWRYRSFPISQKNFEEGTRRRYRMLLSMGRIGRWQDGGLSRLLWYRGIRRRILSESRRRHYSVYWAQ